MRLQYSSHVDAHIEAGVLVAGLFILVTAMSGCADPPSEDQLKERVCTKAMGWAKPRITARFDDLELPSSLKKISCKESSLSKESEVTDSGGTRYYTEATIEFEVSIEEFDEKKRGEWNVVSYLTVDPGLSETELNWKKDNLILSAFPTKREPVAMSGLLPPSYRSSPPSYPITDGSVDWNQGIVELVETEAFEKFYDRARPEECHVEYEWQCPLRSRLDRTKKRIKSGLAGVDFYYYEQVRPWSRDVNVRGLFTTGKIAWTYDATRILLITGTKEKGFSVKATPESSFRLWRRKEHLIREAEEITGEDFVDEF